MLSRRIVGVYSITNLKTRRVYIGSSAGNGGILGRKRAHYNALSRGTHCNRYLQHAWNKYGSSNFRFAIVERCTPSLCLVREQFWIDFYRSKGLTYNLSPTAGNCLGIKRSEKTKKLMSRAAKLCQNRPEVKAKNSASHTGKTLSDDVKTKISIAVKLAMTDPAIRQKLSLAGRRPMAEETKSKISKRLSVVMLGNKNALGCVRSPESRKKISESNRGKRRTEEVKRKLSEAAKRRSNTPEGRAHLSRAGRIRHVK